MPINIHGINAPDFAYVTNGTALIKNSSGMLAGIFIAAASDTPTMKLFNDSSVGGTATTLIGTFTPAAATFYDFKGVIFSTALYAVTSGTVKYTALYL